MFTKVSWIASQLCQRLVKLLSSCSKADLSYLCLSLVMSSSSENLVYHCSPKCPHTYECFVKSKGYQELGIRWELREHRLRGCSCCQNGNICSATASVSMFWLVCCDDDQTMIKCYVPRLLQDGWQLLVDEERLRACC